MHRIRIGQAKILKWEVFGMGMMSWLTITLIVVVVTLSLIGFIFGGRVRKVRLQVEMKESRFSMELFFTLLIIYCVVIIGFGLIYFILSMHHILLVENGELRQVNTIGSMIHSLYFSGVTLLTIGYGDIIPIGIGRVIALAQALIGYILPTAFVLKLVQNTQTRQRN